MHNPFPCAGGFRAEWVASPRHRRDHHGLQALKRYNCLLGHDTEPLRPGHVFAGFLVRTAPFEGASQPRQQPISAIACDYGFRGRDAGCRRARHGLVQITSKCFEPIFPFWETPVARPCRRLRGKKQTGFGQHGSCGEKLLRVVLVPLVFYQGAKQIGANWPAYLLAAVIDADAP